MTDPRTTTLLQDVRASTAGVLAELAAQAWSDAEVAAPSLLAGWTRGHVLTHIARNADAVGGSLAGGLRGEVVALYPGGSDDRTRDIEAGAKRSAAELIRDVRESADRLDRVCGAVADAEGWDVVCAGGRTGEDWLFSRWCELEIHRVDARIAGPDRWPADFVARLFPEAADPAVLSERVDRAVRLVADEDSAVAELAETTWSAAPRSNGGADPAIPSGADPAVPPGADPAVPPGPDPAILPGPDPAAAVVIGTDPVVLTGPDWALLAWVLGRGAALDEPFDAPVTLTPWPRARPR